jgi:DNA-directed RNA polymerase subunit RPC12/RpoP
MVPGACRNPVEVCTMTDIFDTTILCKNCKREMQKTFINKEGSQLRAVQCARCNDKIIHPADLNCLEHYKNLKGKTYNVKLRVVGNSHAISIPKEIVNFIREQEKAMDDIVRLHFEDMHKLSLRFGGIR